MAERSTAIVTGGSTGIGSAICGMLLERGYRVIALSRRPAVPQAPALRSIAVDLTDVAATERVARELASLPGITTLVHNAGVTREALVEDVSAADFDALTHLHLTSAALLLQACLPSMKAAGHGRVVLVSSRGMLGLARRTVYAATKAGMVGMARTWAVELAGHGITVNVVAPGPIEATEMFEQVMGDDVARRERLARAIPVGRLGRPEDVAHAVGFFVDDRSSFVTGQTLFVCGGASVGGLTI